MAINLTTEQRRVLDDESNVLIVSAGPGSGKTEILSFYILKKIQKLPIHTNILVCSFTNKGAAEIKKRTLKNSSDKNIEMLHSVIFSTFDSFLLNHLWRNYLNRSIIFICNKYKVEYDSKHKYKFEKIAYDEIKYAEFISNHKDNVWMSMKIKKFVDNLKLNIFSGGFISDFILFLYISDENSFNINKYIKTFFDQIIVDEAQDLNILRYNILIHLNLKLDIKLTLIGDERQTLYKYLGASSGIFDFVIKELKNNGPRKIELTENHRYRGGEEEIKKLLMSGNEDIFKEQLLNLEHKFNEIQNLQTYIGSLDDKVTAFILTDTNQEVKNIVNLFNDSNNIGAYLKIDDEIVKEMTQAQKDFVENLYVYNLLKDGNKEIKSRIDIDRMPTKVIFEFLWPNDPDANNKFLKLFLKGDDNKSNFRYIIQKIEKEYDFNIKNLWEKLEENQNYLSILLPKRIQIMTIHGSKGLEADVICLSKKLIQDYKNKKYNMKFENIFVAISRVKKEIIIY